MVRRFDKNAKKTKAYITIIKGAIRRILIPNAATKNSSMNASVSKSMPIQRAAKNRIPVISCSDLKTSGIKVIIKRVK